MTGTADEPRSGSRLLKGALLVSLALNMLFIGVSVGRIWAHRHGDHERLHGISAVLSRLPADRRKELSQLLEQNRSEARALRGETHKLRREVRKLISQEPFDKAALIAALERVSAARAKLGETAAKGLAEVAERMTVEERKALAERGFDRKRRHRKEHED